jgi:hypothetical protein
MSKMTAQIVHDIVADDYDRLGEGGGFAHASEAAAWQAGCMFAYAHVIQLLLQMEEVDDERGEREGN